MLLICNPLAAQPIVTSPGPSSVAVTVYRAPDRGAGDKMQLDWLGGYALISETRTITIPAGEADIRFEGVAGGILPESAIVSGLPDGVAEKNQDAFLLSPSSLLDRSLGARVHLRRTSRATGAVREEEAIVRTGADGGVVVQTAAGYEALRCSGLPEAIVYDRVPAGLSAKPTLSVRTQAARRTTATVTLSYLASGFDWQANYVGKLSPDGTRMDLFAWVTLANGDETSFLRAATQTVAGRLNRQGEVRQYRPRGEPLRLTCYPLGTTTSDLPETATAIGSEEIIVTGSRIGRGVAEEYAPPPPPAAAEPAMMAQQEELGDLKLYRIPDPVTVAAKSQKQVALLKRGAIKLTSLYRRESIPLTGALNFPLPAARVYKARNLAVDGLGVALPAGGIALFSARSGRPILVGEAALADRAIGEDVEIVIPGASGVRVTTTRTGGATEPFGGYRLEVSNDRPVPIEFEQLLADPGGSYRFLPAVPLERRGGRNLWRVTVPANGRATLDYRVER